MSLSPCLAFDAISETEFDALVLHGLRENDATPGSVMTFKLEVKVKAD